MFVEEFKSQYAMFLMALQGTFNATSWADPAGMRQSTKACAIAGQAMIAGARATGQTFIQTMLIGASPELSKKLEDLYAGFILTVRAAVTHNIMSVDRMLKANMLGGPPSIGTNPAMIALAKKKESKVVFRLRDSLGRQFDAMFMLARVARHFADTVDLEVRIAGLAKSGDLVEVRYPSPDHVNNGLVFSISGTSFLFPSFESIRAEIFHPGYTASVISYVHP